MQVSKPYINWTYITFFTVTPLIALVGTVLLCVYSTIPWQTWALAFTYLMVTGITITAGYHRLFSHRSYQASLGPRIFFLLFGAASFEGSALDWCTDHRNHHLYTDTEKDPYNIKKGFWYAHIGWIFTLNPDNRDFSNVEDLQADKLLKLQDKYFYPIAAVMGLILPALIAMAWGDFLGGLMIAGFLRVTLNHHFTFAINSLCHYMGKRTYSDRTTARDNWVTALLTYGEGFHNFHHQFPVDYRNGIRFFHYDPGKWIIRLLSWGGLASDLKRISDHKIIRYRLQMEEKALMEKIDPTHESYLDHFKKTLEPMKERIHHILNQIEMLEKEYLQIQREKFEKFHAKMSEYKLALKTYRQRMKRAKQELKSHLLAWSELSSSFMTPAHISSKSQ